MTLLLLLLLLLWPFRVFFFLSCVAKTRPRRKLALVPSQRDSASYVKRESENARNGPAAAADADAEPHAGQFGAVQRGRVCDQQIVTATLRSLQRQQ